MKAIGFKPLVLAALLLAISGMQACGFHPRGTQGAQVDLPAFVWNLPVSQQALVRQYLRFSADSPYQLKLAFPACLKRPIAFDASGFDARYEMTCRLEASVTEGEGEMQKHWLKPVRFVATREYPAQGDRVVNYEQSLKELMTQSLVEQLHQRLSRVAWPK